MNDRIQAREWFRLSGISVHDWAMKHGFNPTTVYAVLSGRSLGNRGEAHQVCIALNLKKTPPKELKFG